MSTCPECGAELENVEAEFCSQCGRAVRGPASDPDATVEETREEYVGEVRSALADGVLDEQDGQFLEDARERLNLTEAEARDLREQALGDVASEMTAAPGKAADTPVVLEINPNQFYMAPFAGVLDFRLANRTDEDLYDVDVSVRAKLLGDVDERRVDLAAGAAERVKLQIVPEKAGVHVLDIRLSCRHDGRRRTWAAQAMLNILAQPKTPSKVVFDQRVIGEGAAKIGFGFVVRNEVPDQLKDAFVFDVNELITRPLPPVWRPVKLRRVGRRAARTVHVPAEMAGRRGPMASAGVYWPGDAPPRRRVLLLGQPTVRMGRSRKNNIVLRLHPRNEANDALSKQISASRPHAVVSLRRDGLFLADQDTLNGTQVNGRDVNGEVPLPLDRPSEIYVARALRLRFVPFLDDPQAEDLSAERYENLGRPDELWEMARSHRLRSLRIERLENLAHREQYLIVYRWALFGRRIDSEVPLPEAGAQIRILRLGGQFWLEGLEDGRSVRVDTVPLGSGRAAPLAAGAMIQCGPMALAFEQFSQIGL